MTFSAAVSRLTSTSGHSLNMPRRKLGGAASLTVALLGAGIVLWSVSLSRIALSQMTDVGLGSVLPLGVWVSMVLITGGCAVAWRSGNELLIVTGILSTILVLYGLGVFGEPTMRFAQTWTHVGIAKFIATHGLIDPHIDAYFNWPGFFVLSAFLS